MSLSIPNDNHVCKKNLFWVLSGSKLYNDTLFSSVWVLTGSKLGPKHDLGPKPAFWGYSGS